jgi:hypothetical protein
VNKIIKIRGGSRIKK